MLREAEKLVAAGVRDHSHFRGGLFASLVRLRSTVRAMLSLTFGDEEQVVAAAAGINTIHDRVNGTLPCRPDLFPIAFQYERVLSYCRPI